MNFNFTFNNGFLPLNRSFVISCLHDRESLNLNLDIFMVFLTRL